MQTTITTKYVNHPKPGFPHPSIKDTDGNNWGFKDKAVVGQFQVGQTYNVEWEQNGKYKNILGIAGGQQEAQGSYAQQAGPRPIVAVAGSASSSQAADIFVTGIVGRAMGSGKFNPADILTLTMAADDAFHSLNERRKMR